MLFLQRIGALYGTPGEPSAPFMGGGNVHTYEALHIYFDEQKQKYKMQVSFISKFKDWGKDLTNGLVIAIIQLRSKIKTFHGVFLDPMIIFCKQKNVMETDNSQFQLALENTTRTSRQISFRAYRQDYLIVLDLLIYWF